MILRRLASAFRRQDWSTVAVEIMIVVLGVFIGIQVANWNDVRIDAGRAVAYLDRIDQDLDADLATLADRKDFWRQVSRYGETGLRYAQTGMADEASHWNVLLAYFQASQVAEFVTTQATYDELRSAGDLELISNLDVRNELASYYNFGAAPTVVERPAYREHVRGIIPMDIQSYIWDSCYESNDTGQLMFECAAPVDDQTARAVINMLADNALLIEELRYWMSTMHVAQLIANDRVAAATALKRMIAAEGIAARGR
ncbi:MAG: hypothetical protein KKC01_04730 [Gammaproteobacteria bacterium]|nr:hypothetical protein [Gammaproteobacteria bacterium]